MAQKIKELFIFMMRLLPLRKMIVFESHPDFLIILLRCMRSF